jgi:2-iminobutanoate/2-iminopropanoate deaminase
LAQVAAVTVYLKNQADFAAMNEVYTKYWPKDPPTRTTVIVNLVVPDALVEISMVALRDGVERRVVHPASWLLSPSPYSYGIQTGNTLFLAGLVSRNGKDNTAVPGDMKTQTQTVLQNATDILGAAGMTMADVVSSRVFITDTAMFQDMNAVYRTAFASAPPVRATVKAALVAPQYLVEITMLAVKGGPRDVFTTPNADGTPGKPNPNLSSAIGVGPRLFLSGMLGIVPGSAPDVTAQTAETLARLGRTLAAGGASWPQVVDSVVYVTDPSSATSVLSTMQKTMGGKLPAGSVVGSGLVSADGRVEIMLTAGK